MTNTQETNGNELELLRKKAKEVYTEINEVHCPYFKEKVHFNAQGFNHIRYKGARKERDHKSQEMRLKLLKLAPQVIRDSKTIQEYDEESVFIEVKHNKRKEKELKLARYFGFIAIIGNDPKKGMKTKVIVRQVGNGQKHFWNIIPNWQTRKSKEGNQYLNHTGNLIED